MLTTLIQIKHVNETGTLSDSRGYFEESAKFCCLEVTVELRLEWGEGILHGKALEMRHPGRGRAVCVEF